MCYTPPVTVLRRVLYLLALMSAAGGAVLVVAPAALLTILGQPPYPDYAWVRLVGVQGFTLALIMVLVGQRIEELWWWSWAFAVLAVGSGAVITVHAAVGLPRAASPWMWWVVAAAAWAFTGGLLWGLARAGTERPPA